MGYMRHNAIIVSSWDRKLLKETEKKAVDIFGRIYVSPIIESRANREVSFFIPPDGSKEGWETSMQGDIDRDNFIRWIDAKRYDDGSSALKWVEVQYGDDEGKTKIIRHSDQRRRTK